MNKTTGYRCVHCCAPAGIDHLPSCKELAAPTKEVSLPPPDREPECGACHGSGWVVRDPDIGTEQECFSCSGSGVDEDATTAPQVVDQQASLHPARPSNMETAIARLNTEMQDFDKKGKP